MRSATFEAHERGLQSIHDAIALPRGRHLLALGDAGIVLVDRDGRRLRHYEHPATRLLVSDTGSRVITMLRRGATDDAPTALGRIDLVSGRSEQWCDARFMHCADSHDGAQWYMSEQDAVAAVDVQAPGLAVIWRVSRLPGRVVALARTKHWLTFAVEHASGGPLEVWTYALGGEHRLDKRHPIELPKGATIERVTIHGTGAVVIELHDEDAPRVRRLLAWHPGGRVLESRTPAERSIVEIAVGNLSAHVVFADAEGCTIEPLPYDTLATRTALLSLHGAKRAGIRSQGDRTIVFDDRGRLVTLDAEGRIVAWQLIV